MNEIILIPGEQYGRFLLLKMTNQSIESITLIMQGELAGCRNSLH
jgi:hypothetical protein